MSKKNHGFSISYVARIGILSAVSAVLMFFPILKFPFMPSFLTLDFSDFPALLASFALGPVSGVLVCLLKNLIHLSASSTGFVGELSNFLLGCFFVIPAGVIYHRKKTFKTAIVSGLAGSASMAFFGFFSNLFVIYPLYYAVLAPKFAILGMYKAILPSVDSIWKSLLIFNVPFTFFKGLCSVLIVFLVYKKISHLLKAKR